MADAIDPDLVEVFKQLGEKASYHYADDSCIEWNLADVAKKAALKVYGSASEPEQEQMMVIARGFLWSMTVELAMEQRRAKAVVTIGHVNPFKPILEDMYTLMARAVAHELITIEEPKPRIVHGPQKVGKKGKPKRW